MNKEKLKELLENPELKKENEKLKSDLLLYAILSKAKQILDNYKN